MNRSRNAINNVQREREREARMEARQGAVAAVAAAAAEAEQTDGAAGQSIPRSASVLRCPALGARCSARLWGNKLFTVRTSGRTDGWVRSLRFMVVY